MNNKAVLILHPKLSPKDIRLRIEENNAGRFVEVSCQYLDTELRWLSWCDADGCQMQIEYDRGTSPLGDCIILETVIYEPLIEMLRWIAKKFGGFLNIGDGKYEEINQSI